MDEQTIDPKLPRFMWGNGSNHPKSEWHWYSKTRRNTTDSIASLEGDSICGLKGARILLAAKAVPKHKRCKVCQKRLLELGEMMKEAEAQARKDGLLGELQPERSTNEQV